MEKRIERLENDLKDLMQTVRNLELRLAAFEIRLPQTTIEAPAQVTVASAESEVSVSGLRGWNDSSGLLSYAGRLFIVMGGAYLLRAFTDASTFSAGAGVTLGLMYSLIWAVTAGRAASKGQLWNAALHGVAAALIAYPLIFEAVTRFKILQPPLDTLLLAALAAAFFAIACKYRFQTLAWFTTTGSVMTVLTLMVWTESFAPGTAFLIVLGITTLWLGYELEWRGLRWLAALAANIAVVGLTSRALALEPKESAAAALTMQLLLLSLYFASVAVRTLVRARNVIPFEVVQIIASFLLGFVAAVFTTRATSFGTSFLGYAGLILGAACYTVAFAFVNRRIGGGRNFYFYVSLALLFALTGSGLLLAGTALSLAWGSLAILMGWLGWRYDRLTLTAHSTISIIASGLASGVLVYMVTAFAGSPQQVGNLPSAAQILAILGAATCLTFPSSDQPEGGALWLRLQRLIVTILLVGGLGGVAVALSGRVLASLPEGGLDPGILATARSVILALAVLLLAWVGRHKRFIECSWLVYPVLAATGMKILLEDLPRSRPATLFIALGGYGCALILSPRIRRHTLIEQARDIPASTGNS